MPMTEPAAALAARIARFEQAADPELIWDPAALSEAEQAMRACAGDRSDAATWRQIGILHLARYRLDPRTTRDAAVAGTFFAAVAVLDPGRLPEKLRGSRVPPGDSAGTWAGLLEEVLGHVDPAAYRHVGLLVHALVRRAVTPPDPDVCERLTRLLLQESMRSTDPSWAPGALAAVGNALARLHTTTGERGTALDAVHVLLRAALGDPAHTGDLAAALAAASPGDEDLIRAYLSAAETPPASHERSQALLTLVDLTQARAATTYADDDLLAFIRAGQCALDFWHEQWAHPGVVAPYASGLIDWYVVTGDDRSLEAATEMLEALHVAPDETTRALAADPALRLGLLADRRWHRYLTTGALADLDDAIRTLHQATRPTLTLTRDHPPSTTHPDRTEPAPDLAGTLPLVPRSRHTPDDPGQRPAQEGRHHRRRPRRTHRRRPHRPGRPRPPAPRPTRHTPAARQGTTPRPHPGHHRRGHHRVTRGPDVRPAPQLPHRGIRPDVGNPAPPRNRNAAHRPAPGGPAHGGPAHGGPARGRSGRPPGSRAGPQIRPTPDSPRTTKAVRGTTDPLHRTTRPPRPDRSPDPGRGRRRGPAVHPRPPARRGRAPVPGRDRPGTTPAGRGGDPQAAGTRRTRHGEPRRVPPGGSATPDHLGPPPHRRPGPGPRGTSLRVIRLLAQSRLRPVHPGSHPRRPRHRPRRSSP
ncbi:Basic proline-rich protein precursor [[Actinomadura] parvosata subsp. kistnae]|nr:Basic proline-rich protein precursor [Actinomadura parvosata subsp. kistnae]